MRYKHVILTFVLACSDKKSEFRCVTQREEPATSLFYVPDSNGGISPVFLTSSRVVCDQWVRIGLDAPVLERLP